MGSLAESKVVVMQPKVVRMGGADTGMSPNRNKSEERDPSEVDASAYESATWHKRDDWSHVAGIGRSRACEAQVGEEQGTGEKEEEALGWKERGTADVAQWSHESSLPVSRTKVAFCGGVPTERDTVKVTLWWKRSLLGALLGREEGGMAWVFRGKIRGALEWERERCLDREGVGWKRRMERMSRVAAMILEVFQIFLVGVGFYTRDDGH